MARIFDLLNFICESNRIEGIYRQPTNEEIAAHEKFLMLSSLTISDLQEFVAVVAPGKPLRTEPGMNVRVGDHVAPSGGPRIGRELGEMLDNAVSGHWSPYKIHQQYETLHPFMDGNGRSGRVLWLWMMGGIDRAPLGFLHHWYYQSLAENRK